MESQLWVLWATLAVSLLYYLSCSLRRGGRGTTSRLPPGPRPLPVVGNLLDLRGGELHHALARLARVHGPVMRIKMGLATGLVVVVSSRDAAREAFTKHDRRLAARAIPDATRALGFSDRSMIWLPSSDPRWKALRGIVATHIFSPRGLAAARGVRERKVRDLVGYFRARAGLEVDVGEAVFGGVLNLVSSAFFSMDVVDAVGGGSVQGLRELVEAIVETLAKPNVSDLVPFLRQLDLQGWRRQTARNYAEIFRLLDGIIDRRMAEAASSSKDGGMIRGDFLDTLLELLSAGKIVRDNLTTILTEVFVAGTDTTSMTVQWAMAELLRNPSVMAKVSMELEGAFGDKEAIAEPDAASLPYLQAVVKEAIRLHPVAPIIFHQAVEDGVEIGGYTVPKGSAVFFNAWAIMRDPAVWDRPDDFKPERFLTDKEAGNVVVDLRAKDFEFIPFGAGRRQCPGMPMAERVVPHILASLLHGFDWRLPDGVSSEQLDLSEKFASVNVLAVPLRAVPVVRRA